LKKTEGKLAVDYRNLTRSISLRRSAGIGASSGFRASFDVALLTALPIEGRTYGPGSVNLCNAWLTSSSVKTKQNIYMIYSWTAWI